MAVYVTNGTTARKHELIGYGMFMAYKSTNSKTLML